MDDFVFGYGSLCFKAIPIAELSSVLFDPVDLISRAGYIKGHVRRFAQESHDHRGTELLPGRVVTLVTRSDWLPYQRDDPVDEDGRVWGTIYRIPAVASKEIWEYLDHREKDGYSLKEVDVYSMVDGKEVVIQKGCKVYVGETDNSSFAAGTTMDELASLIAVRVGPSGCNRDYLYSLNSAIQQLSSAAEDTYLTSLARLVREKCERDTSIDQNGTGEDILRSGIPVKAAA